VGLDALLALPLRAANGALVPLSELVRVERGIVDAAAVHQGPAGRELRLRRRRRGRPDARLAAVRPVQNPPRLAEAALPGTGEIGEYWIHQPSDPYRQYALKWDGESQITYDTFRDMGAAYGVGLILIYLLVVAQFPAAT